MNLLKERLCIAERLIIPMETQAILWDMDGVLIDSLQLDLTVCNQLLAQHFGAHVTLTFPFIRSLFAYDPQTFWEMILAFVAKTFSIPTARDVLPQILESYEQARRQCAFALNPGIIEILTASKAISLKMAVVSNNPTKEVELVLDRASILPFFDCVIGNDLQHVAKKPAPDMYLLAVQSLNVRPERCVVVEDSLLGLEAGQRAHGYTVGVASGGATFAELTHSALASVVYQTFAPYEISLNFGDVRQKNIVTPNEFVSHMLEHIAWRLGIEINLHWYSDDMESLGYLFGKKLKAFPPQKFNSVALGMIDDGSAEVSIAFTDIPELKVESVAGIDLDWFLSLRCEQLNSGHPLITLMQGLVNGLGVTLAVRICSVEDPHHSWEGIFRALGIALHKIFVPPPPQIPFDFNVEEPTMTGDLKILARALHYSKVFRGTAESHVAVSVDFSKRLPNQFIFNVSPTINVNPLATLLTSLAEEADFTVQVEFNATVLSSSHVVLEDTALVLGRALLEILVLRMTQWGVNGAGSSVESEADFAQPLRVGVSVEGRKFWKFVPFTLSMTDLRKDFIIGQNVCETLFSEDLDDFLDGLAGGLTASILIHIATVVEPSAGWPLLFKQLGKALREVFAHNPQRRGVPPGVKATLA